MWYLVMKRYTKTYVLVSGADYVKDKRRKGEINYRSFWRFIAALIIGQLIGVIIQNRVFGLFIGFIIWCIWD